MKKERTNSVGYTKNQSIVLLAVLCAQSWMKYVYFSKFIQRNAKMKKTKWWMSNSILLFLFGVLVKFHWFLWKCGVLNVELSFFLVAYCLWRIPYLAVIFHMWVFARMYFACVFVPVFVYIHLILCKRNKTVLRAFVYRCILLSKCWHFIGPNKRKATTTTAFFFHHPFIKIVLEKRA